MKISKIDLDKIIDDLMIEYSEQEAESIMNEIKFSIMDINRIMKKEIDENIKPLDLPEIEFENHFRQDKIVEFKNSKQLRSWAPNKKGRYIKV